MTEAWMSVSRLISWNYDHSLFSSHWWCSIGKCGRLTLSPPIPLRLYTSPYWYNTPFLIFDIQAIWRSEVSARALECQKWMSKIKNGGLDQYGTAPFEQQQFRTAGIEGVKTAQLAFSAHYNIFILPYSISAKVLWSTMGQWQ